jgi:nucleoid-associated protein YgaU
MKNYITQGLFGLAAAGLLLVGYNAFVAEKEADHTASAHIAKYLKLEQAKTNAADEAVEVATENTPKDESTTTTDTTESQTPTDTVTMTPPSAKAGSTYTVKEGDTYGCIAEKYYGSFENWTDVFRANPSYTEGFSEYELHVGAELVLPALTSDQVRPASSLCS